MINDKKNNIKIFKTIDEMNISAADFLVEIAEKSVQTNGRFLLCLSGGNTPKSFYKLLSESSYRDLIPWKNTFVFWVDERCVPMNDERNNAHMAFELLLNKIDIPASNIYPIKVNSNPSEAAKNYEQTLKNFFGNASPDFDLILLGLGENGHTASLFPGTSVIHEKTHWVKEVFIEELQMYRITLTPPIINKAKNIFFLVTGEEKSKILKTVFSVAGEPEKYPVLLIKPENGKITWFVNQQAASGLLNKDSDNFDF